MNKIKSYRDLIVWHKAMDLVAMGYDMAKALPEIEGYCPIEKMLNKLIIKHSCGK